MKEKVKKVFVEFFGCILSGMVFGWLGLMLGWEESRTGAISGAGRAVATLWLIAGGMGMYSWHLAAKSSNRKKK